VILDEIVARRRADLERRASRAVLERDAAHAPPVRSLAVALRAGVVGRPHVIAEFKRRSPSAGALAASCDLSEVVRGYAAAGASAISVLTNEPFFGGSLDDLGAARAAVTLPILRKDFLLDEIDVLEARARGADAVLLIVRILETEKLRALITFAHSLGMEALVEAHDRGEVEVARLAGATIIGLNHRDLDTLTMDLSRSIGLREWVGPDAIAVAESGIRTPADVATMQARSVDAILVGEALLKTADPGQALRQLIGAPA
jgi:indole-3-glycerol phosphate synthase